MTEAPVPALHLARVRRHFADLAAVDGVSLAVTAGELLALVGPSGCGKSTLLRLVAGLLAVDDGEIHLAGRRVNGPGTMIPPEDRRIGVVFQDHTLFPHLTVAANVAFGLTGHPRAQARERVRQILDLVELPDHGHRYPHELSGGEGQRVALARALAPQPDVVLLDEPFASLDPNLRAQVRADTVEILRRADATAVIVTHDQREALAIGDRVAVMRAGRLEQLDTPEAIFHSPANRFVATFLGTADFLPARPDGNGRLHTEAGTCPAPRHLPDAQPEVLIRPHEVHIHPDHTGTTQVTATEFQGAFVLHTLRLGSGRRLRSLQPHTHRLAVGQWVTVELTHGHPPAVFPPGPSDTD